MQKAAFISDAHLCGGNKEIEEEKERRLLNFLEYAKSRFDMLCICGDLFDFWFEYRHAVVNRYYKILYKLSSLVDAGIKIHYVAGNHDFWMRDFLTKEVGIQIHKEVFETTLNKHRIYAKHGDGIYKKDRGYLLLKAVLQNKLAIQFYRCIHPDIGVPIAQFCSNMSRDRTKHREFKGAEAYKTYAQDKLQEGFDIVVLAHTHYPHLEQLQGGCYLNLGDWISHFTFGTISDKEVSLYEWDDAKNAGKTIKTIKLPPAQKMRSEP